MPAHLLERKPTYWKCPSCLGVDRTFDVGLTSRMHSCPAMHDMTVPFVEVSDPDEKVKVRHRFNVSDDYVGDKSPITAVQTEHMSGREDCTVYAVPATVFIS